MGAHLAREPERVKFGELRPSALDFWQRAGLHGVLHFVARFGRVSSLRSIFQEPTLFLNYMSARDFEQFDKPLKLRCPWILEPNLASLADAL
jgi:hypothetical protein